MSSDFFGRKIGVIGYGRFGRFLCEELLKEFRVFVYSPRSLVEVSERIIQKQSLEELVVEVDFLIPAVPIRRFEEILIEVSSFIKAGTVIMDICSVKEYPVRILQNVFGDRVHKIATHPMFGPSPYGMKGSLVGFPMVMYNAGCDEVVYNQVREYFVGLGLQVVEISPEEHDRLAAGSQFFAQLVKFLGMIEGVHPTFIDTPGASALFEAFNLMNVSDQLVLDMVRYNKYAGDVLEGIRELLEEMWVKEKGVGSSKVKDQKSRLFGGQAKTQIKS